jgi:chromosome segregation protein
MTPPAPGAERLDGHIRGRPEALVLAKVLLRDTWVVETLEEVAAEFAGVAVTRRGRVWSPRTRELRQAPAVGEERVLAERNRREELIRANEAAARQEVEAVGALERATAEVSRLEEEREVRIAAHRGAIRRRDEASEDESRVAAQIERRRAAPDEGPNAAQRLQLEAKLEVERGKLERVEHERAEREATRSRLVRAIDRDERLAPGTQAVIGGLEALAAAISAQGARFEAALSADREAGQHVAEELRACAQKEATLHAGLHGCNETLTQTEVRLQRARDEAAEAERDLREIADRLELEATPASEELDAEQRDALGTRIARLARRREQLGPVNPLAQQEYADAVEHVEELERQRSDLEGALRELEKLIADTDRQIRETFEQTFEAAARSFEQVVERLFPGGRGHLRLVSEREGPARVLGGEFQEVADDDPTDRELAPEEDLLGVEIEITPAGKEMKRLSLLSGGEKSMTALAFLFAVFLARPCPFYILDEVEAALDDLNIDRFLELLRSYSQQAQFIVVTHQRRTMEAADSLYGVSMGGDGISKVISRRLPPAEAAA